LIASEDDNFNVSAQLQRLSIDQTGVQDYQNKGIHFAIECIEEAFANGYLVYFLKLTYDKYDNVVNEEQLATLIHQHRDCHLSTLSPAHIIRNNKSKHHPRLNFEEDTAPKYPDRHVKYPITWIY